MAPSGFDLTFVLSAEDRLRARAVVDGAAQKREGWALYFLSRPGLSLAVMAATPVAGIAFLIWLAPWQILTGDPQLLLRPKGLLCLAVVVYAIWFVVRGVYQIATGQWRPLPTDGAGREGVHWGQHRMKATAEGLTLQLALHRSVYRWTAVAEIRRTRDLLLLMLAPRTMIAIPRSAFGGKGEEQAFCSFVEDRVRDAA